MQGEEKVTHNDNRKNIITRTWNGDVPLWKLFWIGFFLVACFGGPVFLIFFNGVIGSIVFLSYYALLGVGIWRSANKYTGKRMINVYLAKGLVIFIALSFAAALISDYIVDGPSF